MLSIELDRRGINTIVACLTKEGANSLSEQCSSRLKAIVCDITKDSDIKSAIEVISNSCPNGLWGLVNNAGIQACAPIEMSSMESFRRVMEVNYFGAVRMTKELLPFLRQSKGRIVNITSAAGMIAAPAMSSYAASKYAVEAFLIHFEEKLRILEFMYLL
eukprot:NODE_6005_length_939_cov_42.572304_g5417_i0.p1 GENE.NODE_6005_length_939_cov_42.572304_g5417_i0~~NODE_6005_length_939_cov_42.572304_g5417_i0.p1  ORF type:complete len:160 (-),score=15.40 NODE_6005_length_939_cov_42.572304_g5417_i0:418-897(-)